MSEKRAAGIPAEMFELIRRFEDNKEAYRSGQYNETQLRREFIDPFFGILGWDVDNRQGYAEADKARHDRTVSLVEQMLSLNKQLQTAKTDHEKTSLQRQIEFTDRQIDQLVYELYGLSEDEIRIVEGKN